MTNEKQRPKKGKKKKAQMKNKGKKKKHSSVELLVG
jgi:hypothetical protein